MAANTATKKKAVMKTVETESLPSVRIVATEERYEKAPVFVCPRFDEITKNFSTGSEHASEAVKNKALEMFVKKDENGEEFVESFPLRHAMSLNPNIPFDAAVLNLAKISGVVALTKSAIHPSRDRFYIENKEDEAVKEISEFERQMKAWELVKQHSSLDDMVDLCNLLGLNVYNFTKKQVEGALANKCKTVPDEVVALFSDPERASKMYVTRLVRYGIIREQNEVYKYGEIVLGSSLVKAIDWFKDKNNADIVGQMNDLLKAKSTA